MNKHLNVVRKMIMVFITSILGLVLILLGILLFFSPGKPEPILDSTGQQLVGSISEKTFVEIGNTKQGMIIRSKNQKNPVLLSLHGGLPDYFLSRVYPTGLEEYFTVVWWEQRGSGLSYSTNIPVETMNLEQMISDTKEVTNYLRNRFGQEKIYLMGRSGGTFIGIHAASRSPELYHAYIGIGQMSNQLESERMGYGYILEKYRDSGNSKMVRKLEASPVTDNIPSEYLLLRDKTMHNLGIGTTHNMNSVITGLFIPSLTCRAYTLREKFNLWRGKSQSGVHPLWNEMITMNLSKHVNNVNIPVYFFHGIYDYTVSYPLARQYFESLNAPVKGFYTFEKSAHSPQYEEPQRVREIFENDILKGNIRLADK